MFSTIGSFQSSRGLNAHDPDLPLLASEAAIDIDNLLAERSDDLSAIKRLAQCLKDSIEVGTPGSEPRALMDPATLSVLGEAVSGTVNGGSLKKLEDLLVKASQIAGTLSSDTPMENPNELRQARDFCIALSRLVMAYHKSIDDLRPSHPFRR